MKRDLETFLKALLRVIALGLLLYPFSAWVLHLLKMIFVGSSPAFDFKEMGGVRLVWFSVLLFLFAGPIARAAIYPWRNLAMIDPQEKRQEHSGIGEEAEPPEVR